MVDEDDPAGLELKSPEGSSQCIRRGDPKRSLIHQFQDQLQAPGVVRARVPNLEEILSRRTFAFRSSRRGGLGGGPGP